MLQVKVPESREELDQVRALFRSFTLWHRTRHYEDIALIDAYFDADAFEAELENLPGTYGPPGGGLYLATLGGSPAGCVALRPIDHTRCEMKRMFVYPKFHGKGVGRALGEAVIACGATAGYKSILLDTSVRQKEAQALYTRLGFREIAPYYELPDDLRDWLVFMERALVCRWRKPRSSSSRRWRVTVRSPSRSICSRSDSPMTYLLRALTERAGEFIRLRREIHRRARGFGDADELGRCSHISLWRITDIRARTRNPSIEAPSDRRQQRKSAETPAGRGEHLLSGRTSQASVSPGALERCHLRGPAGVPARQRSIICPTVVPHALGRSDG